MPADDVPNVADVPSAIDPNQLLLHVTLGAAQRAYLVQPGITIGRSPDCAICLEPLAIGWAHAQVERVDERLRVKTCDYHWLLTRPNGFQTREVFLADGVEFRIEEAHFRCAAAQVLILPRDAQVRNVEPLPPPPPPPQSSGDDEAAIEQFLATQRLSCPQCSELLLLLPELARFCPRCGAKLIGDEADRERSMPRPATIAAYVNALLSLAHRFEFGRDGDRNAAQALRYYRKAAKLGNRLARFRLSMSEPMRDTHV
jgi:hypothetical protein